MARTEDLYWFVPLCGVIFVFLLYQQARANRRANDPVRLEVTSEGLVIGAERNRNEFRWSAFSQVLESPKLFVLVDRTKTVLFVVPRRAFPDESAAQWFRAQTSQIRGPHDVTKDELIVTGEKAQEGEVEFIWQLKFRDYLERVATSWRTKGIFLGIFALMNVCFAFVETPENPVHSTGEVYLFMMLIIIPMAPFGVLLMAGMAWISEREHLKPQRVIVSDDGIRFSGRDSAGAQLWENYDCYRESRWNFFLWNKSEPVWVMFPKRNLTSAEIDRIRELLMEKLKLSRWFRY